ncbi:branched-chain amino acid transport system substrate-binding protein [Aquisalimonas asiatica]|uniref:Branched-chain amino acid transport system substrate-binding protein n=2 Tax=Aquisalimonas asiatica TaxID=406100 RepID=A0A1H8PWM3_9GAMM|nr:branched-chain amino acid transport system substrate-binding protein [Aquisalimonas asiatica]
MGQKGSPRYRKVATGALFCLEIPKTMNTSKRIPVGILFSTEGPYGTVGRAMRDGAMLALEQVNADPVFPFELVPHERNPGGDTQAYSEYARGLLRNEGVKHIVGCYTSSSRKEIIPAVEKYDGLLWYPSHYEGFETNSNVVYTGAVQNHHVLPLMEYVLANVTKEIYFVGSNYVWAWENGRIIRELINAAGGRILAERYLQVDDLDVAHIIEDIHEKRPAFIMNMLIGESSYAFYRAFAKARAENPDLAEAVIGSCTLCEPELARIGPAACANHLSSSVYFSTVDTGANREFVTSYRSRYGTDALPSADAEASYNAVHLLARAVSVAGSAEIEQVKDALPETSFEAPQGLVWIDPENNHSYLTPRLGLSRADASFRIVFEANAPVRPDPYLIWADAAGTGRIQPEPVIAKSGAGLRVVR